MLASVCPGWVCYAEKAQGDMLPMLSGTRSSQAIIGGLAKTWWGDKMNLKYVLGWQSDLKDVC